MVESEKGDARMASRKRELIEPNPGDKRYVRRNAVGQFEDVADVGKSLAADRRSNAKTTVKAGQGDKGDVKRAPAKRAATKRSKAKPAARATAKRAAKKK